jgi:hypothetical protein
VYTHSCTISTRTDVIQEHVRVTSYQPPKLLRKRILFPFHCSVEYQQGTDHQQGTEYEQGHHYIYIYGNCGVTTPAHFTQPTRAFMRTYWCRFSIINHRRDVVYGLFIILNRYQYLRINVRVGCVTRAGMVTLHVNRFRAGTLLLYATTERK